MTTIKIKNIFDNKKYKTSEKDKMTTEKENKSNFYKSSFGLKLKITLK